MTDLKNKVKRNFDAFDLMVVSTTFLSSTIFEEFKKDAEQIISFISSAYDLDNETRDEFYKLIMGDMQKIGLADDYVALSNLEFLDDVDYNNLTYYEIKGKAIETVYNSSIKPYFYNKESMRASYEKMRYDSFHHVYDSVLKFKQIEFQASFGDVNSTRQLGIMYYLGIGCERNIESAITYLRRSMFWGDIASTALLSEIYLINRNVCASKYKQLFELERDYLMKGKTDIVDVKDISADNRRKFILISMIKQYLVINSKMSEINIPFINVIDGDSISFKEKCALIISFDEMTWRKYVFGKKDDRKIEINWRC